MRLPCFLSDGRSSRSRSRSEDGEFAPYHSEYGSDEELFYDCEEGSGLLKSSRSSRSVGDAGSSLQFFKAEDAGSSNSSVLASIQQQYGGRTMAVPHPPSAEKEGDFQQGSARDMAVNIVETLFVLAEFSFWKVLALLLLCCCCFCL